MTHMFIFACIVNTLCLNSIQVANQFFNDVNKLHYTTLANEDKSHTILHMQEIETRMKRYTKEKFRKLKINKEDATMDFFIFEELVESVIIDFQALHQGIEQALNEEFNISPESKDKLFLSEIPEIALSEIRSYIYSLSSHYFKLQEIYDLFDHLLTKLENINYISFPDEEESISIENMSFKSNLKVFKEEVKKAQYKVLTRLNDLCELHDDIAESIERIKETKEMEMLRAQETQQTKTKSKKERKKMQKHLAKTGLTSFEETTFTQTEESTNEERRKERYEKLKRFIAEKLNK